jgi:hypothetical protein
MPLQDKLSIIVATFFKIAILWWPATLFIVGTIIVGIIKESKDGK